jgi:feruloyl esterase
MKLFVLSALCVGALWGQGAGNVQFRDLTTLPVKSKPAGACAGLRSLTSFDISVIAATVQPASANAPEHCRVSLMVPPEINIEVNLPTEWNGRLYMFGNGGWAGESFEAPQRVTNRARGLKAGFVTAATDTGHSAVSEPGASFAANRQKLLDFGFRSLHVTAEAAKMIARAYYGAARRSPITMVVRRAGARASFSPSGFPTISTGRRRSTREQSFWRLRP